MGKVYKLHRAAEHPTKEGAPSRPACFLLDLVRVPKHSEEPMGSIKILALVLVIAGVLALAYGGFTYTKETHDAKVGPIEMSVKEREHVNIPMWAGIAAVGAGAVMLLVPAKST